MHLFAHLLPLLATLLAVTQATDGDDLARQICRTYNRPSKLYCVTVLSYVICAEGGNEVEKTVDTGMWCEAGTPLAADGPNNIVPSTNPDMWALPYARPGINVDEQDNATHSELRQRYLGQRGPGGMSPNHDSEL